MFELINIEYKEIITIPHLRLNEGFTALLGASGSGKTTILKMLCKMISPTQGRILFRGKDLQQIDSVTHRRTVMMLTQNPAIFNGTIRDNLIAPFRLQEKDDPGDERILEVLIKVQLNKDLEMQAHLLSGGEKQRLALARVLLCDPAVYLLDEPSSSLDDDTEDEILRMVSEAAKARGKSVIMVSHSRSTAEKYAEEIIEMGNGAIINRNGRLTDEQDY